MGFRTGLDAINQAVKDAESSFGPRLNYKTFKDGDKLILRFLDDDVIVGGFAEYVVTKKVKKKGDNAGQVITQDFLVDPEGTNWVEKFGGLQKEYLTGKLISPKLRTMGVSLAVVREEVPSKAGNGQVEVVDKKIIVEADGKKLTAREYVLIKQSIGNFWQQFGGMAGRYGSMCDRDYEITRVGGDKNTKYTIAPLDKIDGLGTLAEVQEHYGYGKKYDEKDPERFLYPPQTLGEWAEYYSGEDRARFWLVGDADGEATTQAQSSSNGHRIVEAGITGYEDEAQAVPSSQSQFTNDLKGLLQPHGSR